MACLNIVYGTTSEEPTGTLVLCSTTHTCILRTFIINTVVRTAMQIGAYVPAYDASVQYGQNWLDMKGTFNLQ